MFVLYIPAVCTHIICRIVCWSWLQTDRWQDVWLKILYMYTTPYFTSAKLEQREVWRVEIWAFFHTSHVAKKNLDTYYAYFPSVLKCYLIKDKLALHGKKVLIISRYNEIIYYVLFPKEVRIITTPCAWVILWLITDFDELKWQEVATQILKRFIIWFFWIYMKVQIQEPSKEKTQKISLCWKPSP